MKRPYFVSFLLWLVLVVGCQVSFAQPLSQEEAQKILADTFLIAEYLEIKGEPDYKNPLNIIKAALFGAFDARARFDVNQDLAKEKGQKRLSEKTPLFQVQEGTVRAKDVVLRNENEALFKGIPEDYNVFVSRSTCELAALHFTGHRVSRHAAPNPETRLTEQGYFFIIEGLGDILSETTLTKIQKTHDGFLLTGTIVDEQDKKKRFSLQLRPGDVPGTWLRTFTVQ